MVYVGVNVVIIADVDVASERFSTTQRPFGVKWVATNLQTGCTHIFCILLHTTAHRHLPHIFCTQYNVRHIFCTLLHIFISCTSSAHLLHICCTQLHVHTTKCAAYLLHTTTHRHLLHIFCTQHRSPFYNVLQLISLAIEGHMLIPSSYRDTLEYLLSNSNHIIAIILN